MTRPQKRAISPSEASQSRGSASQPGIARAPAAPGVGSTEEMPEAKPRARYCGRETRRRRNSLDHADLGMRREQGLREDGVEGKDAEEGDHDGLVYGAADAGGAAGGVHPLIRADDGDDRAEERAFKDRAPKIRDRGVVKERREEAAERGAVG